MKDFISTSKLKLLFSENINPKVSVINTCEINMHQLLLLSLVVHFAIDALLE